MRENPVVYRLSERNEILPITTEILSNWYLSYYWYSYYSLGVLASHYGAPKIFIYREMVFILTFDYLIMHGAVHR